MLLIKKRFQSIDDIEVYDEENSDGENSNEK